MKVLFVCYANVGRSQVAQACFQKLSRHDSESAGIAVDELIVRRNLSGRKLKDVPGERSGEYVRKEFGLDIREKERRQLTSQMVKDADMVVVIAEKDQWPDWLQEGGKVVFWDIPDARGQDRDFALNVYNQVRARVEKLVGEIG